MTTERWPDRTERDGDTKPDTELLARLERLEGLVGKLTSHLFGPSAANEADKEENE